VNVAQDETVLAQKLFSEEQYVKNSSERMEVFPTCTVGHLIKEYIVFNLSKCKASERHLS